MSPGRKTFSESEAVSTEESVRELNDTDESESTASAGASLTPQSVEASSTVKEVRYLTIIVFLGHTGNFGQIRRPSTSYCSAIKVQEVKLPFGFPVFLKDATTTSGPTEGATSSAKISWNSGLSKSEDFADARVRLEPEVC